METKGEEGVRSREFEGWKVSERVCLTGYMWLPHLLAIYRHEIVRSDDQIQELVLNPIESDCGPVFTIMCEITI